MWGIWSGCQNLQRGICPILPCWAKGLTVHFPRLYPDGFNPHYYPEAIDSPKHLNKPSLIGVGWVGDTIGYCKKISERSMILQTILQCPQHTFLFLTKNSECLIDWSPFPENCQVGVTVVANGDMTLALTNLAHIVASVKYISFEPLLGQIGMKDHMSMKGIVDWVIIGAQTKPYRPPRIEWVQEIVEAADKVGIPVFLKNNLKPLLVNTIYGHDVIASHNLWAFKYFKLRQDMPI
jgi:hypothetical protein